MGTLIAGPFCGQLMGDMGAEVIKKLSATPGSIRSIAPQSVGQDNAEVLGAAFRLAESGLEDLARRVVI